MLKNSGLLAHVKAVELGDVVHLYVVLDAIAKTRRLRVRYRVTEVGMQISTTQSARGGSLTSDGLQAGTRCIRP